MGDTNALPPRRDAGDLRWAAGGRIAGVLRRGDHAKLHLAGVDFANEMAKEDRDFGYPWVPQIQ